MYCIQGVKFVICLRQHTMCSNSLVSILVLSHHARRLGPGTLWLPRGQSQSQCGHLTGTQLLKKAIPKQLRGRCMSPTFLRSDDMHIYVHIIIFNSIHDRVTVIKPWNHMYLASCKLTMWYVYDRIRRVVILLFPFSCFPIMHAGLASVRCGSPEDNHSPNAAISPEHNC